MNEMILDNLVAEKTQELEYGGFWVRTGALFLDGLILAPITVLAFVDLLYWKSLPLLLVLSLAQVLYKPFMEYKYGATLGKRLVNLKVVDLDNEPASLNAVVNRNIFNLLGAALSLAAAIMVFSHPDFADKTTFMSYSAFAGDFVINKVLNGVNSVIFIVEIIVLLSDKQKRSLHDKIAGTMVVVVKEN